MPESLEPPTEGFWDTQLISYMMKGVDLPHEGPLSISSVSAQELLLMQRVDDGLRYGIPPRWVLNTPAGNSTRRAAGSAVRSIASDVRNREAIPLAVYRRMLHGDRYDVQLPGGVRITEALHRGVTQVINGRRVDVLAVWLQGEHKSRRRLIRSRFDWLVERNVQCHALTPAACKATEALFSEFTTRHTPKAELRNTLNDLLILGHAMTSRLPLFTADRVLSEFASARLDASAETVAPDCIRIAPQVRDGRSDRRLREKRGSRSTQHHRMKR